MPAKAAKYSEEAISHARALKDFNHRDVKSVHFTNRKVEVVFTAEGKEWTVPLKNFPQLVLEWYYYIKLWHNPNFEIDYMLDRVINTTRKFSPEEKYRTIRAVEQKEWEEEQKKEMEKEKKENKKQSTSTGRKRQIKDFVSSGIEVKAEVKRTTKKGKKTIVNTLDNEEEKNEAANSPDTCEVEFLPRKKTGKNDIVNMFAKEEKTKNVVTEPVELKELMLEREALKKKNLEREKKEIKKQSSSTGRKRKIKESSGNEKKTEEKMGRKKGKKTIVNQLDKVEEKNGVANLPDTCEAVELNESLGGELDDGLSGHNPVPSQTLESIQNEPAPASERMLEESICDSSDEADENALVDDGLSDRNPVPSQIVESIQSRPAPSSERVLEEPFCEASDAGELNESFGGELDETLGDLNPVPREIVESIQSGLEESLCESSVKKEEKKEIMVEKDEERHEVDNLPIDMEMAEELEESYRPFSSFILEALGDINLVPPQEIFESIQSGPPPTSDRMLEESLCEVNNEVDENVDEPIRSLVNAARDSAMIVPLDKAEKQVTRQKKDRSQGRKIVQMKDAWTQYYKNDGFTQSWVEDSFFVTSDIVEEMQSQGRKRRLEESSGIEKKAEEEMGSKKGKKNEVNLLDKEEENHEIVHLPNIGEAAEAIANFNERMRQQNKHHEEDAQWMREMAMDESDKSQEDGSAQSGVEETACETSGKVGDKEEIKPKSQGRKRKTQESSGIEMKVNSKKLRKLVKRTFSALLLQASPPSEPSF